MSSEVKRYSVVLQVANDSPFRQTGDSCTVPKRTDVVLATDYAALEAECDSLKNSLLAITARHFAESWKERTSDAELEQYLSAGIAQLESERDALAAQQSAQPEFCCRHSYKVAKQAAWGARDLTQCKCDHNEYCEHCWPDDFREGGKWHGGFETKQSAPGRVADDTRMRAAAEQPDTVGAPRKLLAEAERIIDSYAEALKQCHAPGGDWAGEEAAQDDYEHEAGVASELRAILAIAQIQERNT